jgi:hypothetical protein
MLVEGHPDKRYIQRLRDQGKIIFHEMEPLVNTPELQDKVQLIMNKFRKRATLLNVETSEFKVREENETSD